MFQSTNQNMFGNGRNINKHGGFVLFSYFGNGRVKCVSLEMVQCEAPKIAKLVYNFNNYGLWYL